MPSLGEIVVQGAFDDSCREEPIPAGRGFSPQIGDTPILIAGHFSNSLFEVLLRLMKDFVCELPDFNAPASPFLFFGIPGGGGNGQQIFTVYLDPVLPTLIVPQRLSMDGHRTQNGARQPPARLFYVPQFGADLGMP